MPYAFKSLTVKQNFIAMFLFKVMAEISFKSPLFVISFTSSILRGKKQSLMLAHYNYIIKRTQRTGMQHVYPLIRNTVCKLIHDSFNFKIKPMQNTGELKKAIPDTKKSHMRNNFLKLTSFIIVTMFWFLQMIRG